MAAGQHKQPNLQVVADSMSDIVGPSTALATHPPRFLNVPTFDGGALILAELRAMREDMTRRFDNLERRFEAT